MFKIPDHWPASHPHRFTESLCPMTLEQWTAAGKPHCWYPILKKDGFVVYTDSGYGFTALTKDGQLADWSCDPAQILKAGFNDGSVYVYLDLEYHGEDVGGLFKRVQ